MIEGRPHELRERAEILGRRAAVLGATAERLRRHAPPGTARAIDVLRGERWRVVTELEALRVRHTSASAALAEYADRLEQARRRAADADARREHAAARQREVEQRLDWLRRRRDGATDPAELALIDREITSARAEWEHLERDRADAEAAHRLAELDRDDAAESALRRLGRGAAVAGVEASHHPPGPTPTVAMATVEAAEPPSADEVFTRMQDHALGLAWDGLLAAAITGLAGRLLAGLARPTELVRLAALLGAFVHTSITSDVRADTPIVRPLVVAPTPGPRRPGGALREAAEVDALGRGDQTVVKVTRLPSRDGSPRWRVALPSTQEWVTRIGDAGAVNDLDANLALVLAPRQRTQYERGVLEALRQAGVRAGDPVLLVGFSQGGIMAAHLASARDDHHWAAVIAAGSPVDAMPLPPTVDVVSVEHLGDPVPRLERGLGLRRQPRDPEAWTTIRDAAASSDAGLSGIHSVDAYDATLRRHEATVLARHPRLSEFYRSDGRERVQYFAWGE